MIGSIQLNWKCQEQYIKHTAHAGTRGVCATRAWAAERADASIVSLPRRELRGSQARRRARRIEMGERFKSLERLRSVCVCSNHDIYVRLMGFQMGLY